MQAFKITCISCVSECACACACACAYACASVYILQMFIDPKTVSKLVFISGDVSDGSDNDLKLKALIGQNWKVCSKIIC